MTFQLRLQQIIDNNGILYYLCLCYEKYLEEKNGTTVSSKTNNDAPHPFYNTDFVTHKKAG